jgi:hypothetical protein
LKTHLCFNSSQSFSGSPLMIGFMRHRYRINRHIAPRPHQPTPILLHRNIRKAFTPFASSIERIRLSPAIMDSAIAIIVNAASHRSLLLHLRYETRPHTR